MWKSIINELPADNQTVLVRILNIYGQLTEATYNATNQTFELTTTNLTVPAYYISRWREI